MKPSPNFLPTVLSIAVSIAVVFLLLSAGLVAQCEAAPSGISKSGANQTTTLTGVIGDAICGRKHAMGGKSDAECTRECVRRGSQYALIVGEKVYVLEGGPTAKLNDLAGVRVVISGTVQGDTIQVKSVTEESSRPNQSIR